VRTPTIGHHSLQNGAQIGQAQGSLAVPVPLDLAHLGMAYVGD